MRFVVMAGWPNPLKAFIVGEYQTLAAAVFCGLTLNKAFEIWWIHDSYKRDRSPMMKNA